jgi:histone H2A
MQAKATQQNRLQSDEIDNFADKTSMKKKKFRYFETYISKVLKQVSDSNGITANSKQQLNSAICTVARTISHNVIKLTICAKKKTISDKEVSNAVKILFSGDLAKNSIREGIKSVENFNTKHSKGSSRQGKAGIIFPPSITEKFLRNFGYSKIMVTSSAPIFLAAVLEYLVAEVLLLASKSANENKKTRITIRDLEISIKQDQELVNLFNKLDIVLLGGGVVPYIHPCLTNKKPKKKKKNEKSKNLENKSHRFRPGTVSLREIKKFQKMSNCLTFAKFPFERVVRQIVNQNNSSMKISKDVFIILQYYIEQYIVGILKDANAVAIHSGRVKLMSNDIEFICKLRNLEYQKNESESEPANESESEPANESESESESEPANEPTNEPESE